ncbi:MAG: tetratricopeptide repeat protein [Firmicutes bacterium]|nr:tetratricopeptide repeat protein [Bacillota bacterium]
MRNALKITCLTLVFMLVFNALPATAASGQSDSGEMVIKVGVAAAVVVGAVCLIRTAIINGKAGKLYREGEELAAAGDWAGAVQAFTKAWELNPKYKDVAAKLATAKEKAGAMYVRLGDEAWKEKQLEAAEAYYRQALQYIPASAEARQKLNQLAQELAWVHYRRGLSYEAVNRWTEALHEFEQAYLLAPEISEFVDHYRRAKANADRDLPLRTVLFFINQTTTPGVEELLARELQSQMQAMANGKYVMLDYGRTQAVLTEQAAALGGELDEKLALDLGRILGVDEVIIGAIHSFEARNRVRIEVSAKRLQIPTGRVSKEVKPFIYTFARSTTATNWPDALPKLAAELAKRLN